MISQQFKEKVLNGIVNVVLAVVSWGFVFYLLLEAICK